MIVARSRTDESSRNAGVSMIAQIAVIVLGFVTRTVFIAELGVTLVGINSLLTSTLALLAIADLGINGAFMYALYKPLSDGDTDKTAAIVRYAGRLYRWVALAVAIIGVALAPFIHQLVRLDEGVEQLEIYYLVLLLNTVFGYLMQNRLILLHADQKIYLTKIYSLVFNVIRSMFQIISLIIFENFIVFLSIQVVFTIANNVVIYLRAGHLYPYLKSPSISIGIYERRSILRSTRALLIYRVGGLVLNNSVPLFISLIVGTVALGYYSNYMLIIGSAVMITEVAFAALTPSIGNLVAGGNHGSLRRVFDEIVLLSILVHGFIAVGIITFVDEFMILWLGSEFVLPPVVVIAAVLNFYVTGTLMPLWSFRSATGLFRKTQMVIVFTAAISIALSFVLGPTVGLAGVVIAPALARLATGAWYEPWLLIREHLSGKLVAYFGIQVGAFALWSLIALVTITVGTFFSVGPVAAMAIKAALLLFSLPVVSWLAFRRLDAFQTLVRRLQSLVQRNILRVRKGTT